MTRDPDNRQPAATPASNHSPNDATIAREPSVTNAADEDRLVRLVGRHVERALDPGSPSHAAFFEWLSQEASAAESLEDRVRTETEAVEFARAMQTRVAMQRMTVVRIAGDAPLRRAPMVATATSVRDDARSEGCAPHVDLAVAAGSGRSLWDQPCEEWVEVPSGAPAGDYLSLTVKGTSMDPLLHSGDVMLVKLGAEPVRDDVVVAWRPDEGYVVKRVGKVSATRIELLSLNPEFSPFVLERDAGVILGTVVLRWCSHVTRETEAA